METFSVTGKLRAKSRPSARRKRNAKQSPKKRTIAPDGNGFLRHSFQPFWGFDGSNWKEMEAEFFRSLSNICQMYQINRPDTSGLSFPQNIVCAFEQISLEIGQRDKTLQCIILQDEKNLATLATVRIFDTAMTLYYIPVRPLWKLMLTCTEQPLAELLLSIFAYLYQIVQIPYYRDSDSYLSNEYNVLEEWLADQQEGEDEKYREHQLQEMQQMQIGGDELRGSLINPFYLEEMENKVTHFKHRDNRELAFKNLGIEALALYQAYPNRSIFDHINPDLLCPEENDRVSAGQYVSFYWSSEDCFNDTLTDMVNNEFQEMGEQEEPTSVQIFSEPQEKETHDFDFETRLFSFINRLIELLNDYDHEEPE